MTDDPRPSAPPDPNMPIAVLTGATSDIGQAIAERLGADGWGLLLMGRDAGRLRRVGVRARQAGSPWTAVEIQDLREPLKPETRTTLAGCGASALIHGAGIAYADGWERTTTDELRQMFSVHVTAFGECLRAVEASLRDRHGSAVAIASIDVDRVPRIEPASGYAATKGALTSYARSLAAELGPHGIRVNVVWPGAIASGMGSALAGPDPSGPDGPVARLRAGIPLGRFGTPADVAGVVRFLVSPDSAYMTGAILTVDGGLTLGYGPT